MSEIRELKAIAAAVPRQIEYRKANPKREPTRGEPYRFGLVLGCLSGLCAGAAYYAFLSPTPAGVGLAIGSLLGTAGMVWRALSGDLRHWSVEVIIHPEQPSQLVRPEIISADGRHIRRPNIQVPPGFLAALKELASSTTSLSRRRLHAFGIITDRNNNEQYNEAINTIQRAGWTDDGKVLNQRAMEELNG